MKQRYFALFLAVLMTCLLPATALADEFANFCDDPNCFPLTCMGPGDPNHGARGPTGFGNIPLNLSSEGKDTALDIPVKSVMTINGITWFPDAGPKGQALISVKDLQAALKGKALLDNFDGLNANDMIIFRDRLYMDPSNMNMSGPGIDNIDPAVNPTVGALTGVNGGNTSHQLPTVPAASIGQYLAGLFGTGTPVPAHLEGKEFINFDLIEKDLISLSQNPEELEKALKNANNVKGKGFGLAAHGSSRGTIFGGNEVPSQELAKALGFSNTLSPAQTAEGIEGLVNSGLSNGFITTSEADALRKSISKLKNGSSTTLSVQDFNKVMATFGKLQDLSAQIGFQTSFSDPASEGAQEVPFFDPAYAGGGPSAGLGCPGGRSGTLDGDGNCWCDGQTAVPCS